MYFPIQETLLKYEIARPTTPEAPPMRREESKELKKRLSMMIVCFVLFVIGLAAFIVSHLAKPKNGDDTLDRPPLVYPTPSHLED